MKNHKLIIQETGMIANFGISIILARILFIMFAPEIAGHGRLLEPPNRSSLWRFSEFDKYNPHRNYNDNQLFCGGFSVQHEFNEGKCGLCGDEYNMSRPRPNEHKGEFGKGVIARRYKRGQVIPASVELTFSHLGYFEFRLCKMENSSQTENEDCFDQYLLSMPNRDGGGSSGRSKTKFIVSDWGAQWFKMNLTLPKDVACEHCVLQWQYVAGNNHGDCKNGTSSLGCGPQETFRGCSDISIS